MAGFLGAAGFFLAGDFAASDMLKRSCHYGSEDSKYTQSNVQVKFMHRMRTTEKTGPGKMASSNFVLVYSTFCPIKMSTKKITRKKSRQKLV